MRYRGPRGILRVLKFLTNGSVGSPIIAPLQALKFVNAGAFVHTTGLVAPKFALWRELVRLHHSLPSVAADRTLFSSMVDWPPTSTTTSTPSASTTNDDDDDDDDDGGDDEDSDDDVDNAASSIRVVKVPLRQLLRPDVDEAKVQSVLDKALSQYNQLADEVQFVAKILFDWVRCNCTG